MKITVLAEVNPSEDPEKVKKAILNIFNPSSIKIEKIGDKTYIIASSSSYHGLIKIQNLIKEQGIEDSARMIFIKSITSENKLVFHVHKQAAYIGVLTFVTVTKESPLGPITFIVETDNIRQLIDWLAPRTIKGQRIYEVEPPKDP